MFNYKCSLGANQDPGVTESLHSQRRNWVDQGEIKGKNWSSKSPSTVDRGIEEKQKLFDGWRNERRWRIAKTFSVVIFICYYCPYVIVKFNHNLWLKKALEELLLLFQF